MTYGPRPPPAGSKGAKLAMLLPTTRVVPQVDAIVRDAYSIISAEIHAITRRRALESSGGVPAPMGRDIANLESLLRSLKLCKDLDTSIEEAAGKYLGKATDEELQALSKGEDEET